MHIQFGPRHRLEEKSANARVSPLETRFKGPVKCADGYRVFMRCNPLQSGRSDFSIRRTLKLGSVAVIAIVRRQRRLPQKRKRPRLDFES